MVLCLCQMPQMVWAAEVTEKMPQGTEAEKLTEAETVPEAEKQRIRVNLIRQNPSRQLPNFRSMIRIFMRGWKKPIKMDMNRQCPMIRCRWFCPL